MGSLLSMQGRMSRAGYFWKGLAASALVYAGIIASMLLMPEMVESDAVPLSIWVMIGIFALYDYDGVNTVNGCMTLKSQTGTTGFNMCPSTIFT